MKLIEFCRIIFMIFGNCYVCCMINNVKGVLIILYVIIKIFRFYEIYIGNSYYVIIYLIFDYLNYSKLKKKLIKIVFYRYFNIFLYCINFG